MERGISRTHARLIAQIGVALAQELRAAIEQSAFDVEIDNITFSRGRDGSCVIQVEHGTTPIARVTVEAL